MGSAVRALGRLSGAWRAPELLLPSVCCNIDMHRLAPHGRMFGSSSAAKLPQVNPDSGSSSTGTSSTGASTSSTSSSSISNHVSEQHHTQQQQQPQQQRQGGQEQAAGVAGSSTGLPPPPRQPSPSSTVNQAEAAKFAELAGQWWDPSGPFAPLHAMNPVRCRFLRAALCSAFGREAGAAAPLAGLRLLDVGCGGGLLAESLARMGAHVTGIDVNEGGIATAMAHAARDPHLAGRLQYRTAAAEQLVQEGATFDAVIASEVIEHVASLPVFCAALDALTRPGGGVAISTLNRTPRSYALAILAAEHLLRWVPPGTHDWEKFVTPEELVMQMEESTGGRQPSSSSSGSGGGGGSGATLGPLRLQLLAGMEYNPITGGWSLGRDTAVNYIGFFSKPSAEEEEGAAVAGAGEATERAGAAAAGVPPAGGGA